MKKETKFKLPSGATRSENLSSKVRFDLLSPHAIRRIASVYAEGAVKHGDRNWEKGMPEYELINRALNHIFLYMQGDRTEDHIGHATWNLCAQMHFEELKK